MNRPTGSDSPSTAPISPPNRPSDCSHLTRRAFLRFVGGSAAAVSTASLLGPLTSCTSAQPTTAPASTAWVDPQGRLTFEAVDYPIPMPSDDTDTSTDADRLAAFTVVDDVVLPEGFTANVIAAWGDTLGPESDASKQIQFGYNCDFTALVPIEGKTHEYYLFVNHESVGGVAYGEGYVMRFGAEPPRIVMADGLSLTDEGAAEIGVSIVHVRRRADGHFEAVKHAADHRAVRTLSRSNVAAEHAKAIVTGEASLIIGDPPGTMCNCSGGVTPWGTVLTCEENFQNYSREWVDAQGKLMDARPRLDSRQFGWVCEIDPKTGSLTKHTSLGRFRHENVALRCEQGRRLAAYMGDDRRGGAVWKFVSDDVVTDPADPANSRLFAKGTLYAAKFEAGGKGRWLPLRVDSPLATPEPDQCASGHMFMPARPDGGVAAVGDPSGKRAKISVADWVKAVEAFTGKPLAQSTLGDLVTVHPPAIARVTLLWIVVRKLGLLYIDAFPMANAMGATPTARPEDLEVHPFDKSVYIAFTDNTGGGDGSPDTRIFPNSKGENSKQYGAIYRIAETRDDPAASTFTWGNFVSSGEAADGGGGFVHADNLVFDPQGNLWMVCDIDVKYLNQPTGREGETAPGSKAFPAVFGNSAMYIIPTRGPDAGVPRCFLTGPMECELTGPTFTDDGKTLIVSVQHPGERHGTRGKAGQPTEEVRAIKVASRTGEIFTQQRTVPIGSNWPSGKLGDAPLPCVISITRDL